MIQTIRPPSNPFRDLLWILGDLMHTWTPYIIGYGKIVFCNIFGLPLYTIQLVRGAFPREIRREISIALTIGWAFVLVIGLLCVVPAPPRSVTTLDSAIFAITISFLAMIVVGMPLYNRVNFGYYDGP